MKLRNFLRKGAIVRNRILVEHPEDTAMASIMDMTQLALGLNNIQGCKSGWYRPTGEQTRDGKYDVYAYRPGCQIATGIK